MLATIVIVTLCVYIAVITVRGQRAVNAVNEMWQRETALKQHTASLIKTNLMLSLEISEHKRYAAMIVNTMEVTIPSEHRAVFADAMLKAIKHASR